MHRYLALLLLATISAAAQQIDDPANLMGERVSAPALADTLPINHGAAALEQLLRKLRTRASMMLIVAHPDDEDSGLLTYESRGMGARVAMLTLTRGEGGQNLMTSDFNDALGLIRTQELLAEDRYTGTDQFFGTEVDFGFSKTKEESLKQWGHDRVLYDAVRAVRLYRPLVLASVFIGGVTDGHGQHQVSGEIAQEVFVAAADPKVFPEMGLPPWAPLRVYARIPFAPITAQGMFDYATGKYLPPSFHNYVTGTDTTTPPQATVVIHEGEVPDIAAFEGRSYAQWARQGLALQKTQIGAGFRIPPPGRVDVGYTLYGSRTACLATRAGCPTQSTASFQEEWKPAKPAALPPQPPTLPQDQDLFTGIDTSLPSLAGFAPSAPAKLRAALGVIDLQTAAAQKLFDPHHLDLTAPPLRQGLKLMDELIKDVESSSLPPSERFNLLHELRIKRVQLNDALVLADGIVFSAHAHIRSNANVEREVAIVGGENSVLTSPFQVNLTLSAPPAITLGGVDINRWPSPRAKSQPLSAAETIRVSEELQNRFGDTRPYFYRSNLEQPFYDISRPNLRNAPATPGLTVDARLNDGGVVLDLSRRIETGSGELQLVPPVSVATSPPILIRSESQAGVQPPATLFFSVASQAEDNLDGPVRLAMPAGWTSQPVDFGLRLTPERPRATSSFEVKTGPLKPNEHSTVSAVVDLGTHDGSWGETYRPVGYPGLTMTNYYTPATTRITAIDVTTAPNLRIGYLPGTGDEVSQFLPSLGVTPTLLAAKDLTLDNLKQYDAVVLGVRAYSAHPELEGTGSAPLNAYARQGGIVIAQYNSGGFDPASAPFPYSLPGDSAHNVVEEDQPVRMLQPANALLAWPNRITSADFDHWVEERGHGFASEWASEYTPLLEMHDAGQDPQRGGLLVAPVGKGAYIYCALALYRQLPEGVPGAYRLMANLLSYAKNPHR